MVGMNPQALVKLTRTYFHKTLTDLIRGKDFEARKMAVTSYIATCKRDRLTRSDSKMIFILAAFSSVRQGVRRNFENTKRRSCREKSNTGT